MRLKEVVILALLVILLQIFDGVVTGYAISNYGHEMESNPIARSLMESFGVTVAVVAFKLVAASGVAFVVWASWKYPHARGLVCRCLWIALGAHLVMAWQWVHTLQALAINVQNMI